ncbi:MAG: DUF92 domain-containing protein [Candidatus Omnitrophota bacterium]
MVEGFFVMPHVAVGFLVNLFFAGAAFWAKSVTLSGAFSGVLLGTWIYAFLGLRGFLVVVGFFILGSFFTRWGYGAKKKGASAEKRGGRRSYREALANCLVGAFFASLAFFTGQFLFELAFVASFATALADTTATELGSLYGRNAFLFFPLRKVPPGTQGALSLEGTLAGILASAGLSFLAVGLALIQKRHIPFVVGGATVGFLGESFLVHFPVLGHQLRNFLNTLFGALIAMALAWIL